MYFEVRETQSGLGDRSDWYPVTQSGTGTGASLVQIELDRVENDIYIFDSSDFIFHSYLHP